MCRGTSPGPAPAPPACQCFGGPGLLGCTTVTVAMPQGLAGTGTVGRPRSGHWHRATAPGQVTVVK